MQAVNSCNFTSLGGRRHRSTKMLAVSVLLLLVVAVSEGIVLTGVPPSFPLPNEPQNQFVFERDGAGNPVTLTFQCPVAGDPLPVITWYRGGGGGVVDNVYRTVNGSYVFPNITAADTDFADGDGVEYYCTATNPFGTIRSRTVRAFYADFKGFRDGPELVEGDPEPEPTVEDVIVATSDRLQWVALECAVSPGSTPQPAIQWVQRDTGSGTDTPLIEDFTDHLVRLIDDGQWLILETTDDAVDDKQYFCQVTNKERFQTARGPLLYRLNPVTEFNASVYPPNGVRVYKPLTNKTARRVDISVSNPDLVAFGTGIAYGGSEQYIQSWRVNGRNSRVRGDGAVGSVTPSSLPGDESSMLEVQLNVGPAPADPLIAYLHLLDPATITSSPDDVRDLLTGNPQSFTCSVAGSPLPTVIFYHNGDPLVAGGAISISGGTLTITPTAEGHSGMYQCLVENDSGTDSGTDIATWTLQVRAPVKPTILSSFIDGIAPDPCLEYRIIQQDDPPVVLSVTVMADPCPKTVAWTLNGTAVSSGDITLTDGCANEMLGDTEFTFELSVNAFTNTIGFYTVSFTNEGGMGEAEDIFVTNRVRAAISEIRPEPFSPMEGSNELCILAGSTVNIVCKHFAYPPATVEFIKGNNPVDLSTDRVTQSCDTLTIFPVEEDDRGTYSCRVQNDDDLQPEDSSSIIELEYCIAPEIVDDLVFTKNNPEEGDDTTAMCEWTGSPTPMVTWFKNGEPLVEGTLPSRIRITLTMNNLRSELQIQNVELDDAGDYVCNVSNPVGFDFQVKRLEVREVDQLILSEVAIIGISAGGAAFIVLIAVVVVLLCCVYQCARRSSAGEYVVPGTKNNVPMVAMGGPDMSYNVDAPDGPDEEPEAFNPDYASLPALRPERPPQYKPTPHYPADVPPNEFQKMPPTEEDFIGPYGHDNGGMPQQPGYVQSNVDDFHSDDAQFV